MADRPTAQREALAQRRDHALARIDVQRTEIAANWRALTGIVRERERGAVAIAQGLVTVARVGGAAAAIWMAGRIRGPRLVRRGMMLMTAARTAGRLFSRRSRARGRTWQKA